MRVLAFADLHLDAPFTWAGPVLARQRRLGLRQTLTRICDLAVRLGVDALCCGGDLYEQERFTPDTAQFLRSSFAGLAPMPVVLAPGNHDWFGPTSLYRQVEWSSNVHIFDQPRFTPLSLVDGFTIWGAAHCVPANTPGFVEGFRVDRGGVHLALFHGSEQAELADQESGKVPHSPFRADQIAAAGLHHAVVGHFHTPRDAAHHTYPGNPEPLTFGETGERAPVLIELDGSGRVNRRRYPVAGCRVFDLVVDLEAATHLDEIRQRVITAVVSRIQPGSSSQGRDLVRVTLVGEVGIDVDLELADLRDLGDAASDADVEVRLGDVRVAYELDALALEPTVRGQFVRDVREASDLTEDQRRRVLVAGLRALDGRRDLDVE